MSEMDDLRGRLEALEAEVDRLREESAATRTLAAMADRDAAEVRATGRANNQILMALRETQREQGEAIGQLAAGQAALQRTVESVAQVVGDLAVGQAELLREIRALREDR
ncbi:hypothetical protein ACFWXO_36875 [Kitasatospora sp. NPDC059088]|uniref:hypothetical protein n=1 Tax=Kitasatospora sp. NPDC059088 TaxID=3346722 RepID=UPI00367E4928